MLTYADFFSASQRLYTFTTLNTTYTLLPEDTFVRLPSSDRFYTASSPAPAPLFDGAISWAVIPVPGSMETLPLRPREEFSTAAHLVLITSVLSSVLTWTRRAHRSAAAAREPREAQAQAHAYTTSYTAHYTSTIRLLGLWESGLPPHLHQTPADTARHIRSARDGRDTEGDLPTYLALHTVYHTTAMWLHRFVRHERLPAEVVRRNIAQATAHATGLLDLYNAVVRAGALTTPANSNLAPGSTATGSPTKSEGGIGIGGTASGTGREATRENPLALPFLAPAALLASDIVSCAGNITRHRPAVLALLQSAHVVTVEVGRWLGSARRMEREVGRRMGVVESLGVGGGVGVGVGGKEGGGGSGGGSGGGGGGTGTWRMERALRLWEGGEGGVGGAEGEEFDVFYGVEEWVVQQTRGDFVF